MTANHEKRRQKERPCHTQHANAVLRPRSSRLVCVKNERNAVGEAPTANQRRLSFTAVNECPSKRSQNRAA